MRAISNKSLLIDNFAKGWADDASLDAEGIYSFQTLINSDIIYSGTKAKIRRRGGYQRHHATALPAVPRQVYEFVDISGNAHLLVIANNVLYHVTATNAEVLNNSVASPASLSFVDANFDYPFITVGDRCFFADDESWYWTSHDLLPAGSDFWCYQVGIDEPTDDWLTDNVTIVEDAGFQQNIEDIDHQLLANYMVAQSFTVPANSTQPVDGVIVMMRRTGNPAGYIRARIETDSSGAPSGTLFDDNLQSRWQRCVDISTSDTDYNLDFQDVIHLPGGASGTLYWMVLQPDTNYNGTAGNHIDVRYNSTGGYANGNRASWNGAAWAVNAGTDLRFGIGLDLDTILIYWYALTYYNSTYKIETSESRVYAGSTSQAGFKITVPSSVADSQVTHIRIYREDLTQAEAENVDLDTLEFDYIGEIAIGDTDFYDLRESGGIELQSTNHRRFSDSDDNLLVPRYLEQWQGRIWAVADSDNVLYFSKKLEGVGSLGVAGDYIYDYFPAENNFALDSQIRAVRKRGEDELVVYTSDNDIHVFRGGNSPLNPPPDLAHQPMFIGENCADSRSLVSMGAHHIYVTANNNIRAFSGGIDEQVTAEEIGTAIKTSMDAIGSVYSAAVYDNQYVLTVDADSDGVLDTLYIIDLSQRIPAWREGATYSDNSESQLDLYHIHVTRSGVMLACPADLDSSDFYVIQLDSGTSDDWTTNAYDGVDITQTIQTQYIIPARRARWNKVILTGMYPSTANIPTITMTATDKSGNTSTRVLAPTGSEDVRGHTSGIKLFSEECAITITSVGTRADEIRGIYLEWGFN